jgi:signal transduction histidine kinase
LIARTILSDVGSISTDPILPSAFNTLQQQQVDQLSVQIQNQASNPEADTITDALSALEQADIAVTLPLQTDVYIFDRNLEVLLAPSDTAEATSIFHALAEKALTGQNSREILRLGQTRSLAITSPLSVDGEIIAAFVLSHPLRDLESVFYNLWLRLSISAGISLVLTGIISLIFARNIQNPVQQLRAASEHLRKGDYAYPLPFDRKDELGDLSRTFDTMRKQLEFTEKQRTRFLSDVAHELRTPLTSIKGLIETLQDGAVEDPNVRDRFLASIERETNRLIRLTKDLLTLTRAEVEGFTLQRQSVDLAELLQDLLTQFEVEIERKSIKLDLHVFLGTNVVPVDKDRLGQVFVNLLDNALRFAPEKSRISLSIDTVTFSKLPAECSSTLLTPEPGTHWALVSVTDEGPGIPEKDLPRIFDRFYRVDEARDRVRGGSGLGLPIAKAIVEAHGGCMWIESPWPHEDRTSDDGTKVSFCLPILL